MHPACAHTCHDPLVAHTVVPGAQPPATSLLVLLCTRLQCTQLLYMMVVSASSEPPKLLHALKRPALAPAMSGCYIDCLHHLQHLPAGTPDTTWLGSAQPSAYVALWPAEPSSQHRGHQQAAHQQAGNTLGTVHSAAVHVALVALVRPSTKTVVSKQTIHVALQTRPLRF